MHKSFLAIFKTSHKPAVLLANRFYTLKTILAFRRGWSKTSPAYASAILSICFFTPLGILRAGLRPAPTFALIFNQRSNP